VASLGNRVHEESLALGRDHVLLPINALHSTVYMGGEEPLRGYFNGLVRRISLPPTHLRPAIR